jgi:UDP-2,3-diacylglucosamine pyrophosphatase LpxH
MKGKAAFTTLQKLYDEAPTMRLSKNEKIVIFSDLHLGDGGEKDDFLLNSEILYFVLKQHYLKNRYRLILNGDIEELKKFPLKKIAARWADLYALMEDFHNNTGLIKIAGNHDNELLFLKKYGAPGVFNPGKPLKAIKIDYHGNTILVFHGHQASIFFEKYDSVSAFFLRYIASPLGIKNYSVSHDSLKKFKIEKKVYNFSSRNKIISIIGHTHRPLFESLSKIDSIKFRIEQLCRKYTSAKNRERNKIEKDIGYYKGELKHIYEQNYKNGSKSSLYNANLLIPCLFNSGTAIGNSGITAIEIAENSIALVHWFDRRKSEKHFLHNGQYPERLGESDFFKLTLKKDHLDYIFTRIKLLA